MNDIVKECFEAIGDDVWDWSSIERWITETVTWMHMNSEDFGEFKPGGKRQTLLNECLEEAAREFDLRREIGENISNANIEEVLDEPIADILDLDTWEES